MESKMFNKNTYIGQDYSILLGKPHIVGTRISVELVLRKMSEGASISDILEMYPNLSVNQVLACLEYAAEMISNEEILELSI